MYHHSKKKIVSMIKKNFRPVIAHVAGAFLDMIGIYRGKPHFL